MARNVYIDIKARTAQYERSLAKATLSTQGFSASLGNVAKKAALGGLAAAAVGVAAIGAAAVAVGVKAATAFAGFEKSLSQIEGLVGIAHDEVVGFGDAIKELSVVTATGPQELAEAMFFITSAGLEGAEALDALEVSAKASAAGLGETAVIADVVTSAMNAYGPAIGGAAEATDVLVAAVREGKAAAPELAGSLGRVIPIASQMGVTFDQVGAAVAAMTRVGLDAAESSTALRSILNSLLAPGNDAKKALQEVGLSAAGLRDELRNKGLFETLQTLTVAFDGQDEATSRVFGNVRALTGVMSLMGSNADATRDIFDELANSTGSLDTAFGVAAETGAFAFEQAKARIDVALLDVGETILPKLADALETIMPMIPDLISSLGDLAISLVELGSTAIPYVVDGFYEAELAVIKFETGLLRLERFTGTGILGVVGDLNSLVGGSRSDWDADKQAKLDWLEVQQRVMKRMHEGMPAEAAAARAMAELTDANIVSADSMRMVQEQAGLTDAEIVTLVGTGGRFAQTWGLTTEQVNALRGALEDQKTTMRGDLIKSMGEASSGNEELGNTARWAESAISDEAAALGGDILPALSDFQEGLLAALDAQESLALAVQAFADPTFKAVAAMKKLTTANEKLAEVQEDNDATAADLAAAQLAVVEATLAAQGALDSLTPMALEAALEAITTALGISDEEARALLETLGILDGSQVNTVIEVNTRFTTTGSPLLNNMEEILATKAEALPDEWTPPKDYHLGGVVPGPMGLAQLAVVHGGEEVITPSDRALRPSGSFTTNTSSNSVTVNVIDSNHRDLQGDIATGLIRAGVTGQVDLIGAY